VIDISKISCPLCSSPYPHITLRISGNGHTFPLTQGATVVGRAELGGSLKVSARHAVFRRLGPETWIESTGSNGTYRWNGSGWAKLPDKKPLLVQNGDLLRLGDVEVQLN
jgi:pSer/pThr/pTyr-binding forkhead associated (FHA) protein